MVGLAYLASWIWPGFEGKEIQVEVYSKHPKVRLYLNNRLIGEKATTQIEEYKATFKVPYSPGKLKAGCVENDKEIEPSCFKLPTILQK